MLGCVGKNSLVLLLLFSTAAFGGSFELRFSVVIENDANDVFPDSFAAFGNPEIIPDELIASPLYQPPAPPAGNYVQIDEIIGQTDYTRSSIAFDPNKPDIFYSMVISAYDELSIGLTGNCVIQLENPEAMQGLPADCLVYLRRFDHLGAFIASYDLSDSDNHTMQWPVSEVSGLFAQLDFLIVDRCTAADLIVSDTINLYDFAAMAANWNQTGAGLVGDIYWDNTVDLKDLLVIAEKWLCSCEE